MTIAGMNHSATIGAVMNGTTIHNTGEANAHFTPLSIQFVVNESANGSESSFDCLAVVVDPSLPRIPLSTVDDWQNVRVRQPRGSEKIVGILVLVSFASSIG
jgi:hypothetical protein